MAANSFPKFSHCQIANFLTSLSRFIKAGVTPANMEAMYQKAHAAIRADPVAKKAAEKKITKKRWTAKKIGYDARKAKVAKAKEEFLSQLEQMKE